MEVNGLKIIDWLLSEGKNIKNDEISSLEEWKDRFEPITIGWDLPADIAIAGGFISDRLAYAFASGYQMALKRLFPMIPQGSLASFCVTELKGGHPAAIEARIEEKNGEWVLQGRKQFITMADVSDIFFTAACSGIGADGKKEFRMAAVRKGSEGVRIEPMPELKFIPEIGHNAVVFDEVLVPEADMLPGDGFTRYVRPFRTVEDLHVFASVIGYLFRIACLFSWDRSLKEQLFSICVSMRALSMEDPSLPHVHVALGGLIRQFEKIIEDTEQLWETIDEKTRNRWQRDRALLKVAGNLRAKRLERAWERYG